MDGELIRAIIMMAVWWTMIFITTDIGKYIEKKQNQNSAIEPAVAVKETNIDDKDKLHSVFEGFQLANISPFIATMGLLILWLGLNYYTVLKTRLDRGWLKQNQGKLIKNVVIFLMRLHLDQTNYQYLQKLSLITIVLFEIIVFGNITGLLTISFSYTGHLAFTFFLASTVFIGYVILSLVWLRLTIIDHYLSLAFPDS